MQLDESKTYSTRDGTYTGLRVTRRAEAEFLFYKWEALVGIDRIFTFTDAGRFLDIGSGEEHRNDLVEEPAAALALPAFIYEACPIGEDGFRHALDSGGRDVVLFTDKGPGNYPIIGAEDGRVSRWSLDGDWIGGITGDLRVPPKPKRKLWVAVLTRAGGYTAYTVSNSSRKSLEALIALSFSDWGATVAKAPFEVELDD